MEAVITAEAVVLDMETTLHTTQTILTSHVCFVYLAFMIDFCHLVNLIHFNFFILDPVAGSCRNNPVK